jgi:anti-anti-sigma factor
VTDVAFGVATKLLAGSSIPLRSHDDQGGAVEIRVLHPGCHLLVSGRLGAATVADVRLALAQAIDGGVGDLVVDLTGTELIDATGLGVFVGAHRRADRVGRRLVLRSVPARMERLLLATRLHRVLIVDRSSGSPEVRAVG